MKLTKAIKEMKIISEAKEKKLRKLDGTDETDSGSGETDTAEATTPPAEDYESTASTAAESGSATAKNAEVEVSKPVATKTKTTNNKKAEIQVQKFHTFKRQTNRITFGVYFYFLGKIINWFFSSIFTIIVVWLCYYYIIFILEDYEIIGMIAMIINIITYIPAAQNISRIIRQGNFKSIPIFNTIIGIFSSICWLTYGILIKNIISIIPNAIGFIISIIHIAIWTFFNLRMKSDDDKNENLSNNEIEDD